MNFNGLAFMKKLIKTSSGLRLGLVLAIVLLLLGLGANAQVTIGGRIKSSNKGRPVEGASITLKDTYDGATADSAGRYSFKTTEKGAQVLVITCVGFKTLEQSINIGKDNITLDITLKEEISEMTAVVITAGAFEASDRKKGTVLDPIDIVTTASANGDITEAIKTLPGAQQVGETEGLFVRGGTAAETRTFIDGTLVNNFFYSSVPNIAQRGRFSPFLFKGTVFSAGGYSALYGQALSSALILESIDLPDKTSSNIGISIVGANAGYQRLAKNKKSSWGFNYDYTNLWLAFNLIKQRQDYSQVPDVHTFDANFRFKTSKTGIIKYYGVFSANRLGFTTPSIDSPGFRDRFSLENVNVFHNLSWKESLSRKWKMNVGLSFTTNRDNIDGAMTDEQEKEVLPAGLEFKRFGLKRRGTYFNTKIVFERKLKGLSAIRFGSEYNYSKDAADFTLYNGMVFPQNLEEQITAGFAEADIYLTNDLAAKFGTRLEHSKLLDKTNLAPRVSLAYKTGRESQLSVAYGIFYQNPEQRYLPSAAPLSFARATHYIAQYQKTSSKQSLRAEIYYKKYDGLVKTGFAGGREVAVNNNGFGEAKGFELFWRDKKSIKNVDYWISYSFLDTKRDFLNFPAAIQPNFAAKHTASLVVKKFVTKWKTGFNMAYNFASGRPHYFIGKDGSGKDVFYDRGTIRPFHNLSFSLNYLPSIGKKNAKTFSVFVLSVSNILNLKQVYGYQYSYNALRREEIVPTSRSFVFLGAFFSIGVDRTDDAINNNL
jgi:hypothetical protein